jgi:hypothetical protein
VKEKTNTFSEPKVALQSWLRPALTPVGANCDYHRFRKELESIDVNVRASGAESLAVDFALEGLPAGASVAERQRRARFGLAALRMELLRHVLGLPSFREYSCALAGSNLLADFCGIRDLEGIHWSSKSTLDRASKFYSEEQLEKLNQLLTETCASTEYCADVGLKEAVDVSVCLVDSTCLEANIHYPVDWVLLRDVSRTLLKAIKLIRGEKLLNRMAQTPEQLARQMNRLCIEMTHTHRRKDSRRRRKAILREMKRLLRRIGRHARIHRDILKERQEQTRWSERQAQRIVGRIEEKLEQIPQVIRQAHERIIGGRLVASKNKILSAHEGDLHTLVRHKAGKPVEFGNALFLAESPCGFILDYKLYRDTPPADTQKLTESLARQQAMDIDQPVVAVVGDRGFDSRKVARELDDADIANLICPRNPATLKERMGESFFAAMQKRRGSTEARIAILKNNGGGRVCRAKGFNNRAIAVGFGVLAHNLWMVARLLAAQDTTIPRAA